jgi:ABC-2 type transport system ATP-binding protein
VTAADSGSHAVTLSGVGKRYRKYDDSAVLIGKGLGRIRRTKRSVIWALRGIDLTVDPQECLGVIGRNGGGKTTMLQVLAGITAPTEGRMAVRGRVAPLMAVGVGFHPELTGRENIYLNSSILGRSRKEVDDSLDSIVAFADIGPFLDTPTKFYSSGMQVRLGFSVAIRSDPDVLLLDEVLAVGDAAFQARCFDRIREMREAGATILIVSHNLHAIRVLCDRVLLLNQGTSLFLGSAHEALSKYHLLLDEDREPEENAPDHDPNAAAHTCRLASLDLLDADGLRTGHVRHGEEATARLVITGVSGQPLPDVELTVTSGHGLTAYREELPIGGAFDDTGRAECDVVFRADLPSATFAVSATLRDPSSHAAIDGAGPISFFVSGRAGVQGIGDLGASFAPATDGTATTLH